MTDRTKHLRTAKPQRRVTARRQEEPERPSDEEIARAILSLKADHEALRRSYNKVSLILTSLIVKDHGLGKRLVLSDADGSLAEGFVVACEVLGDGMHVWLVTQSEGKAMIEDGDAQAPL
jgi:hypothetical protein